MNTFLDKLNLRPQERRLVVMGSANLFHPVAGPDWVVGCRRHRQVGRSCRSGIRRSGRRTRQRRWVIAQIQAQVSRSKVNQGNLTPVPTARAARTNLFFDETTISMGINPTGDEELIDFLVAMGSSDLVIRVKQLDLKPDTSQSKLTGSMQLVASFQKNTATRPGPREAGAVTGAGP